MSEVLYDPLLASDVIKKDAIWMPAEGRESEHEVFLSQQPEGAMEEVEYAPLEVLDRAGRNDIREKKGTDVAEEQVEEMEIYRPSRSKTIAFSLFSLSLIGLPICFTRDRRSVLRCQHRLAKEITEKDVLIFRLSDGQWVQASECHQLSDSEVEFLSANLGKFTEVPCGANVIQALEADPSRRSCWMVEFQFRRYCLLEYTVDEGGSSRAGKKKRVLIRMKKSLTPSLSDFYLQEVDSSTGFLRRKEFQGLTHQEARLRLSLFGRNAIPVDVPSVFSLFLDEVSHPFFAFQIFSIGLWIYEAYWFYAVTILIILLSSSWNEATELHNNRKRLAGLTNASSLVKVSREGTIFSVSSHEVVPGDLLILSEDVKLPCDATLIDGIAVLNEASLTGESSPVRKYPWYMSPSFLTESGTETTLISAAARAWEEERHIVFDGTTVIQAGRLGFAVVTKVSTSTTRGQVLKGIILKSTSKGSKKGDREQLEKDAIACLFAMFWVGLIGVVVTLFILQDLPIWRGTIYGLDLLTTIVPPALPAAVTFGIVFAVHRLRARRIICTDPEAITKASTVDTLCFDKTGTLTELGLEVHQILPCSSFPSIPIQCKTASFLEPLSPVAASLPQSIATIMGCCHSLIRTADGRFLGDEVDLRLFEVSGFHMAELEQEREEDCVMKISHPLGGGQIVVKRVFDFSSELARMSVLTERARDGPEEETSWKLYVKGAPEVLSRCCLPESLPRDFFEVLDKLGIQGFRLLGLASRDIPKTESVMNLKRPQLEKDLTFEGLVILENKLKPDTTRVINNLLGQAKLKCLMVTGDHVRTALSVAKMTAIMNPSGRCLIVDVNSSTGSLKFVDALNSQEMSAATAIHRLAGNPQTSGTDPAASDLESAELPLAVVSPEQSETDAQWSSVITGAAFRKLLAPIPLAKAVTYPSFLASENSDELETLRRNILRSCHVFARMSAADKKALMRSLEVELHARTAMCGDGANDAGALQEARIGVSLYNESSAEGELAASIAAPFTSQYTSIQSIRAVIEEGRCSSASSIACFKFMVLYSWIEFSSVLFLYYHGAIYGDLQFLFIDLLLIYPLAIFMGRTPPAEKLKPLPPPSSLFELSVVVSTIGTLVCNLLCQMLCVMNAGEETVLRERKPGDDLIVRHSLCTMVFLFVNFQYIWTNLAFNSGFPYRKSILNNLPLLGTTLLLTIVCYVILLSPPSWASSWLELEPLTWGQRLTLLILSLVNLAALAAVELLAIYLHQVQIHWRDVGCRVSIPQRLLPCWRPTGRDIHSTVAMKPNKTVQVL